MCVYLLAFCLISRNFSKWNYLVVSKFCFLSQHRFQRGRFSAHYFQCIRVCLFCRSYAPTCSCRSRF